MIRRITYKYVGFCAALLLAAPVNAKAALTSNENYPVKFQVRHFQPRLCYFEYDQNSCNDICAAAKGYQRDSDEAWFHISDILSYPPLYTELFALQAFLHYELYQGYINTPTAYSFTPASDELRKQNFRLNLLDRLEREATELRYAAVYRRYSFGIEVETSLDQPVMEVMSNIDRFLYF